MHFCYYKTVNFVNDRQTGNNKDATTGNLLAYIFEKNCRLIEMTVMVIIGLGVSLW